MRLPRAAWFAAAALLAACQGTAPQRFGSSSLGFSAVLIGARILTPTGETKDGRLAINLESDAEYYRLALTPGQTSLFRVEPGIYRVYPTRNLFGFSQAALRVEIGGRPYRVKFPREILRRDPYDLRPTKAVALGVLEARLAAAAKGQEADRRLEVRLDSSPATRRKMIEGMIERMMDPKAPPDMRDNVISWSRSLEQALIKVQAEEEQGIPYKPSP